MIIYKPIGIGPLKEEWLENAVQANTDGWGLLVRNKDGVMVVNRGFDEKTFAKLGSSFGGEYDVVAHARIGTSGKRDIANLHPFPIYDKRYLSSEIDQQTPQAYLFHNGMVTVPMWNQDMSDTWHLARLWESVYGDQLGEKMRHRGWRRRQRKFIGDYNKLVLVNAEGVRIINPTAGYWIEGTWHSNKTAVDGYAARYEAAYRQYETCNAGGDSSAMERWMAEDDDDDWVPGCNEAKVGNGIWTKQEDGTWKCTEHIDKSPNHIYGGISAESAEDNAEGCGEDLLPPLSLEDIESTSSMFGGLDIEDTKVTKPEPSMFQLYKEREAARSKLIEEWVEDDSMDAIEETIYNNDAGTIAMAIRKLLYKAGYMKRSRVVL